MSNEGFSLRVPTEGGNAELNDGELFGGIFDLEVPNIGAVELEGFPPGGCGNAGHLQIDGYEIGGADVSSELGERGFEVGSWTW